MAQMTAWIPCSFRYNSAANNMPRGGAVIYNQNPVHNPAGRADAKDLAGFMLNPEYGDSTMMYVATSNPAKTPVNEASPCVFVEYRTISMRKKEITNSAKNATATPSAPGMVAT